MTKQINYNSLRLLISNWLSIWWRTVFKVFLNIYLWKETNDLQVLALFNIFFLLWHLFTFVLVSPIVKLWHRRIINFLSYLWFVLSYLLIIFLWEQVINNIYFVWIIFWAFNGCYYINYNVNQFDLTTFKNRWNFEWIKKWIKTISKMIFPAIIWVIIWMYNINMAFIFWIIIFIIWFFVSDVKFDFSVWETHYKKFIQKALINKKVLYSILGSFFFTLAFSMILLEVLLPLLIFNEVWSEIKLWFSLSFLSIISIFIIYLFWKIIDYKHYNKSLILMCVIYILWLLWLVFSNTYTFLLFYWSLVIGISTLYSVWVSVITSNSLHSFKNYEKYRVEFVVLKEVWYVMWWVFSFLLMYFSWDLSQNSMMIIFYTMIWFSIISTLFLIKINIHEIEH